MIDDRRGVPQSVLLGRFLLPKDENCTDWLRVFPRKDGNLSRDKLGEVRSPKDMQLCSSPSLHEMNTVYIKKQWFLSFFKTY